jgi:CubicO group peptidase (beta-lactamase class C family)
MIRRVLLAVAAIVVLAGAGRAQETTRMEQVVQSYAADKQFMGAVLVAREGKIVLNSGYGFANLEWSIPNAPTTKFRLGSITKQFTAASVLLLEERGKLKLEDKVKKHLPDAPAAWDKITVFHLLTHTSGIPSFTGFPDYMATNGTATSPRDLIARFRDKPLEFEPGEKWNYSNSGYAVLGSLIETVSGQTYAAFVEENIFKPLGMTDSGYDSNSALIPRRAAGYAPTMVPGSGPDWKNPVNAGFIHMTIPFAAGGLYSTTEDLLRWEQGLFGGKLLSPASLQKMTTPFKQDYGLGVGVSTRNGRRMVEHGGGIEGFATYLSYSPDDKIMVAVLANVEGGVAGQIAGKLAAVARGEAVVLASERKEISVPAAVLAAYQGTYELAPTFSITMTVENGQLMTQATNQPKFPLFAESETKFFLKVVDAQVEFVKDEKGQVTHLVLYQGGREVKGVRR